MAKPKKQEGNYTIAELAGQIADIVDRACEVWDQIEKINGRLRLLEQVEVGASADAPPANKATRQAARSAISEMVRAELKAEATRNPMFRYHG